MPSNINPRSGPFPVYSSTSPPTVDVGTFTIAKTGINLKASGVTTVFTVPAGRAFLATSMNILVTAVTTGGAGVQIIALQESSSNRIMIAQATSASTTPVAGQTAYGLFSGSTGGVNSVCAAGNNVNANVATSHAGSTAVTGTVFVTGFYTQ